MSGTTSTASSLRIKINQLKQSQWEYTLNESKTAYEKENHINKAEQNNTLEPQKRSTMRCVKTWSIRESQQKKREGG